MDKLIQQLKNSILEILEENQALARLPFLISLLTEESERQKLQSQAIIFSALPLPQKLQNLIEAKLKEKLKGEVHFDYQIEPSIKGGLKIKINDQFYDYSLERRLADLGKQLLEVR